MTEPRGIARLKWSAAYAECVRHEPVITTGKRRVKRRITTTSCEIKRERTSVHMDAAHQTLMHSGHPGILTRLVDKTSAFQQLFRKLEAPRRCGVCLM